MSNVPSVTWTPNGFVIPAEPDILIGVQADFDNAFGADLNKQPSTPQGQLSTAETALIGDKNAEFLYYVSQVDPAFAEGRMQDGIGRIYFMTRFSALPTTVDLLCTGLVGAIIPAAALAKSLDGNLWLCVDGGTIGIDGNITLSFACSVTGPIACPESTVNEIGRSVPGWESCTNPNAGVIGALVESRAAFEARRKASVAVNAVSILDAILANVLGVPNALDCYVTENTDDTSQVIGGVSLLPHSVYVAASGGTDLAVASAIFLKKNPGANMNGNTTITITDNVNYQVPYPTYAITFERPVGVPVFFAVTIVSSSSVPSNAAALIQAAIVSAFAGGDGGPRARIGATVFASRYYAPLMALGSWVQLISVCVGPVANPTAAAMNFQINQVPTIDPADIAVVTS